MCTMVVHGVGMCRKWCTSSLQYSRLSVLIGLDVTASRQPPVCAAQTFTFVTCRVVSRDRRVACWLNLPRLLCVVISSNVGSTAQVSAGRA